MKKIYARLPNMPEINHLSQLISLVRSAAGAPMGIPKSYSNSNSRARDSGNQKLTRTELKKVLGKRLSELGKDQGRIDERLMIETFVETLLAWEFGNDILHGANARQITDKICDQIMTNILLKKQIMQVLQAVKP